jgi:hypothetical protein
MRRSAVTPAPRAATSRAAIRVAAVGLAAISLTGCGGAADKADDPSTTPAGASAASATGSVPAVQPQTGSGGGAYCDVFRAQGAKLLLLTRASTETDPAKVKADFDSVVAVYQALADAAPPELRGDAELLLRTYQEDREAIARAGWTPRAVINTLADDLNDDDYLNAAGHQMTYLKDVCQVDPANPAALPTATS